MKSMGASCDIEAMKARLYKYVGVRQHGITENVWAKSTFREVMIKR